MAAAISNQEKNVAEQDQSMEEILQSIRRIIAEESDEATEPVTPKPMTATTLGSEVLELTDMVQSDGSVVNLKKEGGADVLSNIDKALGNESSDGFLSENSAKAASAALKSLAATGASAAKTSIASPAFRSGNTVEDLVMEALRPMLKDWLDANLPSIVERIVTKEVRKLASGD